MIQTVNLFRVFLSISAIVTPCSGDNNVGQLSSQKTIRSILVAGSLNADTFLPISRFPSSGENLTLLPNTHPLVDVPGGKGCNQAIACAKLSSSTQQIQPETLRVAFLGQFGNDAASQILESALTTNNVDIKLCGKSQHHPSGRGYVMIVPDSGEVSAVISPGSNFYGWSKWGVKNPTDNDQQHADELLTDEEITHMISSHSLLQLQCEIPDLVNKRLASVANKLQIPVILDVGGEDRHMDPELLKCCDYLIPNETELERLAGRYPDDERQQEDDKIETTVQQAIDEIQPLIGRSLHVPTLLQHARRLQQNGANHILITLGSHGSLLVKKNFSSVLYQPSCQLPTGARVVLMDGPDSRTFAKFRELCYKTFIELRKHCYQIILLVEMLTEGNEDLACFRGSLTKQLPTRLCSTHDTASLLAHIVIASLSGIFLEIVVQKYVCDLK